MKPYTLRLNPTIEDTSWSFKVPSDTLVPPSKAGVVYGKSIKFTPDAITLQIDRFPTNRILQDDNPSKFLLISFGMFRFPDTSPRVSVEYMNRLMKAGLFLNNIQYRFYHHSNSQLRGRSCFFRQANSDAELDNRIYKQGDFKKIMNIAKRAKRIGLLFSSAPIDLNLDPKYVSDIPDIKTGDENFSDGCGLISKRLAVQLSRAKKIIFRGSRYTPCVYQIRYLGYKGVLMLHPQIDKESKDLAQFRASMKKFSATPNTTFSVVAYSQPYAFGRLNNDIIVLLSSLGVSNEALLRKQDEYFHWIEDASRDLSQAVDFLSCLGQYDLAERVFLDGLDDPTITKRIRSLQMSEVANFKKNDKPRARMLIKKSRRIFGVCDPYRVLKEGQVHIRITTARKGPSTPIHGDVLVVRNPCLHPGDCLKLRAVQHPKLGHLIDCVVFASVARPGHHAAPSMSSGGDLDGDEYFVCWDPDLVPPIVAESYDYPPNKEHVSKEVTRLDLANHFASYNASSLAKVAALHQKWVRSSPQGALSSECQELNALHSQSVDGARIKIPDRLLNPPEATEPYIIDLLTSAAVEFASKFIQSSSVADLAFATPEDARTLVLQLLSSSQSALSEYELFNLAFKLSRKHGIDARQFLPHIHMGALSASEKYALSAGLELTPEQDPLLWNSLVCSDIVTERDLKYRQLDKPWSMQRFYSSKVAGLSTFFEYFRLATQDFTRKLLILKTDDRFAVGIFMRGDVPWDEDPEVNDNVVVCSFMPQASAPMSTYRPCTAGYRLHCSDANFQLYDKNRGNTFVFITRPPVKSGAELAVSIALQKISGKVQQQMGRMNRAPITAIEIHVVSNRDRVAHQFFDMWFEHVPTEAFIKRFQQEIHPYTLNALKFVDWDTHPPWLRDLLSSKLPPEVFRHCLTDLTLVQLDLAMKFCLENHAEDELFGIFNHLSQRQPFNNDVVIAWIEQHPPLVFVLLKVYPPDGSNALPSDLIRLRHHIVRNIVRSANRIGIASLVALEKIASSISEMPLEQYLDLLMLAALCVRAPQLVQEVLLVLNDSRSSAHSKSPSLAYAHRHALSVAFDRAEEAADECPCDEDGKPRRQRTAPAIIQLFALDGETTKVKAHIRVDARTNVRLHSHVRLQAASKPEKGWVEYPIMDGVVMQASRGEMLIELMYPPPPEMAQMQWKLYNAGSVANSKAMMDALLRLVRDGESCCQFHDIITSPRASASAVTDDVRSGVSIEGVSETLNPSQLAAVQSCEEPLSLIWGPPGTGKTTVVVQILRRILQTSDATIKILMTASTHNAVDNVLERFAVLNNDSPVLPEEKILRVATDHTKVSKALQSYTVDARLGGDMNENNRLAKQAQERVKSAVLVFTTCAGAGLGILRKINFDIALIDEASQITEPCALIPLVKGCRRAILVGDHVQLRPTVQKMAKALEYDVSLMERLYTAGGIQNRMQRTMLDVQYRFPKELADFPSREFYQGKLKTGVKDSTKVLSVLANTSFPWPLDRRGMVIPTVFIQCGTEEEMGGTSKRNIGQAQIVARIIPLLANKETDDHSLKVTALTPYSKQVQELKNILPPSVPCFTVDSFQGRESDIIVFSSVRCNATGEVGFLEDARRLNVMWTRAKLALIIIGDERTITLTSGLWKRAVDSCTRIELPEDTNSGPSP